jgi:hypothetical protein
LRSTENSVDAREGGGRLKTRQPIRKPVGLKLYDDILNWFKSQRRGYKRASTLPDAHEKRSDGRGWISELAVASGVARGMALG